MHPTLRSHALIPFALLVSACSADESDPFTGGSEEPVTYYRDVKPILDANCVSCHQPGNIGVGSWTSYQESAASAALIAGAALSRTMPPWHADPGCNTYQHDPSLSDEDIATLVAWNDAGAPEGDPATAPVGAPAASGLSRIDATLGLAEPYSPDPSKTDDFRCFVVEWPETELRYVTGIDVRPTNRTTVHHLVSFYAGPAAAQAYRDADAADPGPGYECSGGPGMVGGTEGGPMEGGGTDGGDGGPGGLSGGTGLLAGWAPGGSAVDFPPDVGIAVEPGSVVVMQMHYNLAGWDGEPDQTAVDLKLEASVAKPGASQFWANPMWLVGNNMLISAGDPDATHSFSLSPSLIYTAGKPFTLYSSMLHMHQRGTSASLFVERQGGGEECLLDIPAFDFNWQRAYWLASPMTFAAGDKLRIECHWDNSPENQPSVGGMPMPPVDIAWGEGTADEMCLGALVLAP